MQDSKLYTRRFIDQTPILTIRETPPTYLPTDINFQYRNTTDHCNSLVTFQTEKTRFAIEVKKNKAQQMTVTYRDTSAPAP